MYLLKKYGLVFAALLVLAVSTLIFVIVMYKIQGVLLPTFSFPSPETTAPPEVSNTMICEFSNLLYIGGIFK